MPTEARCPKCDQPPTQVGQFWVCPQHGRVSLGRSRGDEAQTLVAASTPLRIFLSYGRDSNEELVRRIKADLEKRGHDVWFDKSEINGGHGWRRSFSESSPPSPLAGERAGVRGESDSYRVLSFRSKITENLLPPVMPCCSLVP